ncbi:hypothetical protein CNR22_02565 [Sphingobacteriaceae bacterium]|nr:hypothetical protein CNR22_02565 [Sphingobacteriaceae bacterium]
MIKNYAQPKSLLILTFLIVSFFKMHGQLAGTYSVPGSFSSIAVAINSLNAVGIVGPVTINIAAGYTETAVSGGYYLYTVVGSSSLNTIEFKKSGAGVNPKIFAYTGGTGAPSSAVQDGVWRNIGVDYLTIDGITIVDPNTSNPSTMEFGIGFFKRNTNDGCQFNTVKNCSITLNRINNGNGVSGVYGSRGIDFANALVGNQVLGLNPISSNGSHSYNKIYSNVIENCNHGVSMMGTNGSTLLAFPDSNNEIGGPTIASGNTVTLFGGIAGSNYSACGIYARGQNGLKISNNVIDNGAANLHRNSRLYGIATDFSDGHTSVSNNTISVASGSLCSELFGISNGDNSGANSATLSVSNNLFSNCTASVNPSVKFCGISNSAIFNTLLISGNTFTNCLSTATVGTTSLIYNDGPITNDLSIANNFLNFIFTDPNNYNGDFNVLHNAAYGYSNTSVTYSNNIFDNVIITGSLATVNYIKDYGAHYLLSVINNTWLPCVLDAGNRVVFINNACVFGPSVTVSGNSVNGFTLTAPGPTVSLYSNSTINAEGAVVSIANNYFNNIRVTGASAVFTGIKSTSSNNYEYYSRKLINNNVLSNIKLNSSNNLTVISLDGLGDADGTAPSAVFSNTIVNIENFGNVLGIFSTSTIASPYTAPLIYANTINSLVTQGTGTLSPSASAVYILTGSQGFNIYRNKISNVIASNSVNATGIEIGGGTKINIYNNIIGHVSSAGTSSTSFNGLLFSGNVQCNVIYNSIFLSGISMGSSCIKALPTASFVLKNNLLINQSPGSSTLSGLALNANVNAGYDVSSNNNLFYASSAYGLLPLCSGISQLKAAVVGREKNSVSENVTFASTSPSSINYLLPSATVSTQIESGAAPISWISNDFYGNARDVNSPDIGAIEGSYIPPGADSLAPTLINSDFTSMSCGQSGRTFTAQLYDKSGVATGSLAPQFYFKINSGTYTSSPGSLASGNSTLGIWAFNINYAVSYGDQISWFLVAQDASTLSNIMSQPANGFGAGSVNNVTSTPVAATYTVNMSLAGTYTVGAGGTFTSLTQAANAYNKACLTGSVTFVLTNTLYTIPLESFPITFSNNPGASATNSLLIIPAAGNTVAVRGTTINFIYNVLKFQDASYITLDGLNSGGSSLSVVVTNTNYINEIIYLQSNSLSGPGNNHLTFKNLTVNSLTNCTSSGIASNGFNTDIKIQNNYFYGLNYGIEMGDNYDVTQSKFSNCLIENNRFGSAGSYTTAIKETGIYVKSAVLLTVRNNTIDNVTNSSTYANPYGMDLYGPIKNVTVTSNVITNVAQTSTTSGGGCVGINLYPLSFTRDILISNNMVTNISGLSSGVSYGTYGLCIKSGVSAKNIKVYHNTFALNFGSSLSSTTSCQSACMYYDATTDIDLRNNIFYTNVVNPNNATSRTYAVLSGYGKQLATMDYNNYFVEGSQGALGIVSTSLTTLAAFKTAFGGNNNSINMKPWFTSSVNAHIDATVAANALVDNLGTPLGITQDIDGQSRSTLTPDMGADEFAATGTCVAAGAGTVTTPNFTICGGQPVYLQTTNMSGGTNSTYQWLVSPTSVGTYTNVNFGSGYTTPYLNAGALSAGTYYFKIMETCPGNSLFANSNVVLVTVIAQPTLTITSSNTLSCSGSTTLSASGAASYTWSTGATSPSIVVTPTVATNYYVTYASSPCGSGVSANIPVIISQNPTLSISSANASVCAGVSATLLASGATSYSWSNGMSGASINPTPSVSTTYSVIGSNAAGCSSSGTVTVNVLAAPTISINGASQICAGQSVSLTASGAMSYTWNNSSFSNSLVASPVTSTVYTAQGTNIAGCISGIVSFSVAVVSPSLISITGPTVACSGQTVILTASGYPTYTWNTGATGASVVVTPSSSTTYSVIGGSSTCSNSAQLAVAVDPSPSLSISGATTICAGQSSTLTASGATTYTWSTSQNSNQIIITPLSNVVYTLSGTNGNNCTSTITLAVLSATNPIVNISASSTLVCLGTAVNLTANGANNYTWSSGGNGVSTTVSPLSTSIYTLFGSNIAGCASSNTLSIATKSLPVISISPSSTSICIPASVSFTANGATNYSWTNGPNSSVASFSPLSSGVFTVSGADITNGCIGSETISVSVSASPTLSISGTASTCVGSSVFLSANGANSYLWSNGSTSASILFTPATTTVVNLSGTNAAGCSATTSLAVNVYSLPAVSVNASSTLVCAFGSATITGSGASSYSLNSISVGSLSVVNPSVNSTYTLSGASSAGCISSTLVTINTNSLPVITINQSSSAICAQSAITFTASGATNFLWTNGPANAVATFTPAAPSVYTVQGIDINNACVTTKTVLIAVNPLPTVTIAGNNTLCAGTTLTLQASGAISFAWSNGSFSNLISETPLVSTVYSVTGTNSLYCSSSASLAVTVYSLPSISVNSGSLCTGSSFTIIPSGASVYNISGGLFIVSPASNTSYSLTGVSLEGCASSNTAVSIISVFNSPTVSVNSGSICSGNMFAIVPSGASSYTISGGAFTVSPLVNTSYSVIGTGTNGCVSNTIALSNLTVYTTPTIIASSGSVCTGQSFTLNPSGANSYTYSGGSNVVSPLTNMSYTIFGTGNGGCISSTAATVAVTVYSLPVISVNSGTICSGEAFSIIPTGASVYTLEGGNFVVMPTVSTNYSVIGTSSDGCSSASAVISSVTVNEKPMISVMISNATLCNGDSATITVSGADTYTWNTGSNASTLTVAPSISTNYTLSGTGLNSCSSSTLVSLSVSDCTGFTEKTNRSTSISVYPNPAQTRVSVKFEFSGTKEIQISNEIGQIIEVYKTENEFEEVDVTKYARGVYYLKIKGKEASGNFKLIVE